ncbi:MAG: DUF5069 domain-containing protein [Candidatus Aquilonibacter sp.]
MQVPDLRREPPRRWSEQLDGVAWLPRLIDKTRASLSGTLGAYLYGQSPVDTEFLHTLGVGHRAFAQIVAAAPHDRAVVDALLAFDASSMDRGRRWTASATRRWRAFFYALDVDDGYAPGIRWCKPLANPLSYGITWMLKRIFPNRPTEGMTAKW